MHSQVAQPGVAGAPMPRIIYGTAWKKERTTDLVLQAIHAGFRGIDTACQPKHYREELVGEAVQQAIQSGVVSREQLYLQTKYTSRGGQDPASIPYDPALPVKEQVKQSFDTSLSNFRSSYLDGLLLHSPLPAYEQTLEAWRAFEELHDSGRARRLGVSNCYDLDLLTQLYQDARVKPSVVQNRFYEASGYDVALRAFCRRHNIAYQTFWTLTANPGLLKSGPMREATRALRCTAEQAMYKFVQQLGGVPLSGTTSKAHMADDLAVERLPPLPPQQLRELAAAIGEDATHVEEVVTAVQRAS